MLELATVQFRAKCPERNGLHEFGGDDSVVNVVLPVEGRASETHAAGIKNVVGNDAG